eukprot:SAG31_NODE_896_length_11159_cov_6.749186_3_plen_69_part_00
MKPSLSIAMTLALRILNVLPDANNVIPVTRTVTVIVIAMRTIYQKDVLLRAVVLAELVTWPGNAMCCA